MARWRHQRRVGLLKERDSVYHKFQSRRDQADLPFLHEANQVRQQQSHRPLRHGVTQHDMIPQALLVRQLASQLPPLCAEARLLWDRLLQDLGVMTNLQVE